MCVCVRVCVCPRARALLKRHCSFRVGNTLPVRQLQAALSCFQKQQPKITSTKDSSAATVATPLMIHVSFEFSSEIKERNHNVFSFTDSKEDADHNSLSLTVEGMFLFCLRVAGVLASPHSFPSTLFSPVPLSTHNCITPSINSRTWLGWFEVGARSQLQLVLSMKTLVHLCSLIFTQTWCE